VSEASAFGALPAMRLPRPFRIAATCQSAATLLVALAAAYLSGANASMSACVGGAIGILGLLAFAIVSRRRSASATDAIRTVIRAEAVKIAAIVLLLWISFSAYPGLSVVAFFLAFIISILLSAIAFAVSDK
jgi:F0F1-type ATP synthase assembly protein I